VLLYRIFIQDIEYRSPLGLGDHIVLNFTCQLDSDNNVSKTNKFKWNKGDYI